MLLSISRRGPVGLKLRHLGVLQLQCVCVCALHSNCPPAGRYHAAPCCFELAHCVVDASPGRYSMAEVEGLLRHGDAHFASAKAWLPGVGWREAFSASCGLLGDLRNTAAGGLFGS